MDLNLSKSVIDLMFWGKNSIILVPSSQLIVKFFSSNPNSSCLLSQQQYLSSYQHFNKLWHLYRMHTFIEFHWKQFYFTMIILIHGKGGV